MASLEQRGLIETWEATTGFDFMGKERVRAKDREGFLQLWEDNVRWLENVFEEMEREIDDYRCNTLFPDDI